MVTLGLADYNNHGKPETLQYPAFTATLGYSGRTGRVSAITVPGLLDLAYTYSHAGDVLSILDNARGFSYAYQYDNLHRLTHETAVGPFYQPEDRDIALYYEGLQVHAVSRVVADTVERLLAYESNGNLTTGYDFGTAGQFPERRLDYDAENMPLSIACQPEGGSTATTLLTYDGEGRRVKKQTGADTVLYVDNIYEIVNGQPVKYVFAGNLRVAKVSGSTVHYFHKDHLCSSSVVTDATGNPVDSLIYEPYGQPRETGQPLTGTVAYTYTDQEWDAETGLYNYDARLYDAVLGRFLSADSIVPDWYNPQALNRYTYALNNPLIYTDPNGHEAAKYAHAWDINAAQSMQYLEQTIQEKPWTLPIAAPAMASIYLGSGMVEMFKLGEGAAEGTVSGVVQDTLRAVGIASFTAGTIAKGGMLLQATKSGFNAFKGYRHALQPVKSGRFTRAGHQLTKHPNIVGAQNAGELTKMFGNQSGINKAAANALKNIMRTGTKNIKPHSVHGQVADFKLPSGLGARFNATTNEFIGFLGRGL